jgi:thiamine biosynthesis lipoprotein
MAGLRVVELPALGTSARLVVTRPETADAAAALMRGELDAIDRAASRFRADSELMRLQLAPGRTHRVGRLLAEAVEAALWAASATGGAVDPTIGPALRRAGYDRDFAALAARPDRRPAGAPLPAAGWRRVELDATRRTLRLPAGVDLDLGATAKALTADRIARSVHSATGSSALVALGGDVATAGPSAAWSVAIADSHETPVADADQVVRLPGGALATSSTSVRRWRRGERTMHHIIDPATGAPAQSPWRTVTVAAATCLAANAASTAAIVLGARAPVWLARRRLPARLVAHDGTVVRVAGWPRSGA